ncbi:MAG: hypothetical protein O7A71_02495 [Chloroflexi bacterium]|nr:hypothetical protein [Chloroflexota bacterium]
MALFSLATHLPLIVIVVAAFAATGCGGGRSPAPATDARVNNETQARDPAVSDSSGLSSAVVLAQGVLTVPAATSFDTAGFHERYELALAVPADLGSTLGSRLVLALRDVSRPDQRCDREHPLSGCATVDWSDFGGVFDNRLTLSLGAGERDFFLSESGSLMLVADAFSPG